MAVSYLDGTTGLQRNIGARLAPKQATLSPISPTGSGMWINATVPIICLSLTDTEVDVADGQVTGGQFYDWGFPVVPRPDLTSQVLVGWGYGCTNNNCYGQKDRSVVWVSPIHDADVYVDYQNKGAGQQKLPMKALESYKFVDDGDHDMSVRCQRSGLLDPLNQIFSRVPVFLPQPLVQVLMDPQFRLQPLGDRIPPSLTNISQLVWILELLFLRVRCLVFFS